MDIEYQRLPTHTPRITRQDNYETPQPPTDDQVRQKIASSFGEPAALIAVTSPNVPSVHADDPYRGMIPLQDGTVVYYRVNVPRGNVLD